MRRPVLSVRNIGSALPLGPSAIAVGLTILTAAVLWPGVPVVTATALVALGATIATVARFHSTAVFLPTMLAHLVVYSGLYALFVGAALHAAAHAGTAIHILTIVDLSLSVCPLSLALELVWSELRAGRSAE